MLRYCRRVKCIPSRFRRSYLVIAIESSCDDASVALIDRISPEEPPVLLKHVTESLDNTSAGGIIPLDARNHHQASLARIVQTMVGEISPRKPDVVCVTRGPGMIGSLSAGYNLAKGLAVAWNVPFIGVHHMLGHLLTPRFFGTGNDVPQYPFVSLLASGGHTMLVHSKSLFDHKIIASTLDIAIGDALDKCAREIGLRGTMLGKELERFASQRDRSSSHSVPHDLVFPNPLSNRAKHKGILAYSFSGFITAVRVAQEKFYPDQPILDLPEHSRQEIAYRIQHAIFRHLSSKTSEAIKANDIPKGLDFVCSGGVASNSTLRNILEEDLSDNNFKFHFPPPQYCTDNALMIGWAGIELWESESFTTSLSTLPTAKWPIENFTSIDSCETQ